MLPLETQPESELEKEIPYQQPILRSRFQESMERFGLFAAHGKHAQAMTMDELKIRIIPADLLPKFPYAEVALAHVDVVQKNNPAIAHFRQPRFKIMPCHIIGVVAVDMQQIDVAISKPL